MQNVMEEVLRLLARLKQQQAIKAWRGKLPWTEDLDAMRTDNPPSGDSSLFVSGFRRRSATKKD